MNITEFLESKQVKLEDLEENFTLVKTIKIEINHNKECINCGNSNNQRKIPSEPWSSLIYCGYCERLLFSIFADRMSGNTIDTILIYRNK